MCSIRHRKSQDATSFTDAKLTFYTVTVILLIDLSKAFCCVPHGINDSFSASQTGLPVAYPILGNGSNGNAYPLRVRYGICQMHGTSISQDPHSVG